MTCDDCGPMAADLKRAVDAWNYFEADARQAWREVSDLKRHLRDRDAHIKNLEAELRPHIGHERDVGEQASLMEDA